MKIQFDVAKRWGWEKAVLDWKIVRTKKSILSVLHPVRFMQK